jgi:hypothetical protein
MRPSPSRPRRLAPSSAGAAQLGDLAAATTRRARVDPRAGRARGAPRTSRSAGASAGGASRAHAAHAADRSRLPVRRPGPAAARKSTGHAHDTPAATCWPISACGESITSAASSTRD